MNKKEIDFALCKICNGCILCVIIAVVVLINIATILSDVPEILQTSTLAEFRIMRVIYGKMQVIYEIYRSDKIPFS